MAVHVIRQKIVYIMRKTHVTKKMMCFLCRTNGSVETFKVISQNIRSLTKTHFENYVLCICYVHISHGQADYMYSFSFVLHFTNI